MKGNSGHHFLGKALLVALGFLVPLLCVEATLRVMVSDHYYVWPPNLEKIFKPAPGVMPGISGDSRFLINAAGVRGTSFPATDEFRVLMLGGSTSTSTSCFWRWRWRWGEEVRCMRPQLDAAVLAPCTLTSTLTPTCPTITRSTTIGTIT